MPRSALLGTFTEPLIGTPEIPDVHRLLATDGSFGTSIPRPLTRNRALDDAPAVSENRSSVTCFAWIGYHAGRATPRQTPRRAASVPLWPTLKDYSPASVLLQKRLSIRAVRHCGDGSKLFGPCGFFSRVSDRMFTRTNSAAVLLVSPASSARPTVVDFGSFSRHDSGRGHTELSIWIAEGDRPAWLDRFVDRAQSGH